MVSCGGNQYLVMFADDMSRIKRVAVVKSNHEAAQAIQHTSMRKRVVDPERIDIRNIRWDRGGEFKGIFEAHAESFGVSIDTNAQYIP